MNPSRYFMPVMGRNPMMYAGNMAMRNYSNFNVFNLLSRFGNGIKNFNWKGMLSGVNKTLNVVNQTIPLVKQAKPMYDNVRSLVRLSKSFKNETQGAVNNKRNVNNLMKLNDIKTSEIISVDGANSGNKPIFFI